MGPKISEAKTPPLRKPVSLLSPLFLPPQFYLSFLNTSLSLSNTQNQCFFFVVLISHVLPLQASSSSHMHFCAASLKCLFKFSTCLWWQNVSAGHMCVTPSLPSSAIVLFLSFCRIFLPPLITPSYLLPALRLPPRICLAYSRVHLPPGPLHNCHTYEPRARTSEHTTLHVQPENAQTGAHGQ